MHTYLLCNIVYNTFVKKFNEEYSNKLLEEQKDLLFKYIFGFSDNGISLKVSLNEEIDRLKKEMKKHIRNEKNITMNKRLNDIHDFLSSLNGGKGVSAV